MRRPYRRPNDRSPAAAAARPAAVEGLERRVLFHLELAAPIADVSVQAGGSSLVQLTQNFDNEEVPARVRFTTVSGDLDLELFEGAKPVTVANFLNYVRGRRYSNTFFHRVTQPATDGIGVIQGGGYAFPGFAHIPTDAPIPNEFTTNGVRPNVRGTISMAKTSDPNSATSEFFINTTDNPGLDNPQNSGGFTVFGQVINNTIGTADAVAALPQFPFNSPFGELPLRNYTQADFDQNRTPDASHLVLVASAFVIPEATFTVASSNPGLVTAAVSNGILSLTTTPGAPEGTATITVTVTDGAETVQDSFDVTVVPGIDVVIGDGAAKALNYTDADGTAGTVTVKGGQATVRVRGTGLAQTTDKKGVTVTGTNVVADRITIANAAGGGATVTFKAKGGDGLLDVGTVTTDGAIKSLSGKQINLTQGLTANAGLGKVAVGGNFAGSLFAPSLAGATVGGALSGGTWTVTGNAGKIAVGSVVSDWIGSIGGDVAGLTVNGDLAGELTARSIKSLTVKGSMQGADIQLTQAFAGATTSLGKLTVTGAMNNSAVRSPASLGTITAASIIESTIYAGVIEDGNLLPDAPADFASAASIKGVTVKSKGPQAAFADSTIAASSLGKLNLGTVASNNAGVPFGVAGNQIASLRGLASTGPTPIKLSRLDDPAAAQTLIAALGNLQDLVIRVL